MEPSPPGRTTYGFLDFRLDLRTRILLKHGEPVAMTAKVFDTLALLVQRSGQVVTKDEFLRTVWLGAAVEESNLSQNIFLLRKLLGEKESGQKIILTHTGVGYSFVPTVKQLTGEAVQPMEQAPPASHVSRSRWLWTSLAVTALAAAFGALALNRETWLGRSAPEARRWAVSTRPGVESYPALSPDGLKLAFTWDGGTLGGRPGLFVQDLPTRNKPLVPARQLISGDIDGVSCPVWSPDGRWIAFVRQGPGRAALYMVPADGGGERKIRDMPPATLAYTGCVAAFSSDGKSLAVSILVADTIQTHLVRLDLATGAEEPLIAAPDGSHSGDGDPAYSPDGRYLAFLRRDTRGSMDIYVAAASPAGITNGEPRRLTHERLPMYGIAWASDSKSIVYSAIRRGGIGLWRIRLDGVQVEAVPGGEQGAYPTIARDNARLGFAVLSENRNLWKIALSAEGEPAGSPSMLLSSTKSDEGPVFSRDGRMLSFFSDRTGSYEIWTCRADGSQPRALTSFGGPRAGLADWSPDGRTILFDLITPAGKQDIFSMPSSGGEPEPLITGPALETNASFSRDGRSIYFSSDRSGRFQIWRSDLKGRDPVQITREGGFGAIEGEDGYVYYSTRVNAPKIKRVPARGGVEETILSDPQPRFFGHWALRGRRIFFIRQPDDSMFDGRRLSELWIFDIAGRRARKLMDLPGWVHHTTPSLALSPDGRTLVYSRIDSASGDLFMLEGFH